jgi:hypothetical protein
MKVKTINFYVLPKRPGYVKTLQVDENAPLSNALAEIEKDVPTWPLHLYYVDIGKKRVPSNQTDKSLTEIFNGDIPDGLSATRCDFRVLRPNEIQQLRNMFDNLSWLLAE